MQGISNATKFGGAIELASDLSTAMCCCLNSYMHEKKSPGIQSYKFTVQKKVNT